MHVPCYTHAPCCTHVPLLHSRPPCDTRYLVRWRGHTSADDEWLRAEELAHCPEKGAEYDATAPRRRAARRADPPADPAAAPPAAPPPAPTPLVPPAGFRLAASSEGRAGAALIGQVVLYRWPARGRAGSAAPWLAAAGLPGSSSRTWCRAAAHPSPPSGRRWCPRCSPRPRMPVARLGASPARSSLSTSTSSLASSSPSHWQALQRDATVTGLPTGGRAGPDASARG